MGGVGRIQEPPQVPAPAGNSVAGDGSQGGMGVGGSKVTRGHRNGTAYGAGVGI